MQCPRCKADLTRESDACARCGLDLRLIRAIDGLQSDLEKTRAEHIRLEGKSRALHSLITETLAGIPRPQAREPMSSEKAAADSTTEWQSVDAVIPKPLEPTAVGEVVRSEITRKLKAEPLSEVLFGQKWMLIGGIVIMVLGIGYFLKYSFDRNWIGPEARVALTYLAGASLLGFGELFRRRSLKHFGLSLSGGGVATLYFASFAAFQIYHLFSQPVSFALMLMVTLLAGG